MERASTNGAAVINQSYGATAGTPLVNALTTLLPLRTTVPIGGNTTPQSAANTGFTATPTNWPVNTVRPPSDYWRAVVAPGEWLRVAAVMLTNATCGSRRADERTLERHGAI